MRKNLSLLVFNFCTEVSNFFAENIPCQDLQMIPFVFKFSVKFDMALVRVLMVRHVQIKES